MEIKINIDIQQIISEAVSSDVVSSMVAKAMVKAMEDAIREATGYGSEFSKTLKKQLIEALPHGLNLDDIAKFSHVLNSEIEKAIQGENNKTIQAALRQAVAHVVPETPSRIKLTELMKLARDGFHIEEGESFYAKMRSAYGGGTLYLDKDHAIKDRYRASIKLSFNEEGLVYALRLDGKDVMPNSNVQIIGKFEAILLSMYVGKTSLELDMDESDVEDAAVGAES